MVARSSILLHIGTHKTATTSLQSIFTQHRVQLHDQGILYPRAGVPIDGSGIDHHTNIAWELLGHFMFDRRLGTLDDLIDEIGASDCENVLLSSEEFSCLFGHPAELLRLKSRFEDAGLSPHIVVTLRDVDTYAESLYVTLASFGFNVSYAEYLERVAAEGQVTVRQNTYCFDYELLVRSFTEAFGSRAVTCIDFDPRDAISPFLGACDWFFDGALTGTDLTVRTNTMMHRIEDLRNRVRIGQERIDSLEIEVEELHVALDGFRGALAASEGRLSRRIGRTVRSAVQRRPAP